MSYLTDNPEFAKALKVMTEKHGVPLKRIDGSTVHVIVSKSLRHVKTVAELASIAREAERKAAQS